MTLRSQQRQLREQQQFIGEQSQNLQLERAELLAAAEDRRTAQARKANMVFNVVGEGNDGSGRPTAYDHWGVYFQNGSDEAFFNVTVRFGDAYLAASVVEQSAMEHPDHGRRTLPVDQLGAHRALTFESPRWPEATVDNNYPTAYFTDASGQRWKLDRHMTLTPQPDDAGL
ncbi:hypothetical protein [Streptomyces omiyaensis]|uniref:hypothetical protein n=1 Tax=Streptomyces omiyaensis TaxID=68247 RepID=UPI003702E476